MAGGTAMTESPPQSGGVFLLGVGAQKAGTSWLYEQLQRRADTDFGVLKEYHVHDARTVPELARFRRIEMSLTRPRSWIQPRSWMRQVFIRQPGLYYDYFAWLLRRRRRNGHAIGLTGDITPSYAAISAETLQTIQSCFRNRGISVRPVFLMRDLMSACSPAYEQRKSGRHDAAEEPALRRRIRKGPSLQSVRLHPGEPPPQFRSAAVPHRFLQTCSSRRPMRNSVNFLVFPIKNLPSSGECGASDTVIPDDLLAELGLLADDAAVRQWLPS